MNSISLALDAQMFLSLLIATVLGTLIGYERVRTGKPSDAQTHRTVNPVAATQNPSSRIKRSW